MSDCHGISDRPFFKRWATLLGLQLKRLPPNQIRSG